MPRKKVIFSSHNPYHVTARCINREWFHIPMQSVWDIYSDYLFLTQKMFNLKFYNFVLMPNHFHLLVRAPNNNLSSAMNYFMRETSRVIGFTSGRINQVYGGPYHKSQIGTEQYFYAAYKYIYRNPVEAGLASKVEEYSFSTLSGLLGKNTIFIPIEEDSHLFENRTEKILNWLNSGFNKKHYLLIKNGLRKSQFNFAKQREPHVTLALQNNLTFDAIYNEKRNGVP